MKCRRQIINRLVERAEDLALLFCFFVLLLVETGYVAWLERIPDFPPPQEPEIPFLTLPPWYGRPRVEMTLLLMMLGGTIAWTALSLIAFFRAKGRSGATIKAHQSVVIHRLKAAAFWAVLAGADLLCIQLLKS